MATFLTTDWEVARQTGSRLMPKQKNSIGFEQRAQRLIPWSMVETSVGYILLILWGVVLSLALILALEHFIKHTVGCPPTHVRKWLMPSPIILLCASNLDAVLSLQAWLKTHQGFPVRYPAQQEWNADRLLIAGLLGLLLMPFAVSLKPRHVLKIAPVVWVGHLGWMMFVYFPLALSTGAPIQD